MSNGFIITSVEKINWDEANYNWDSFYSDQYYAQYLLDTFNITIPSPPNAVLWDHAILLTISFPDKGGGPGTYDKGKKKKHKKKIKLIFMIDNMESVFEKEKNDEVKVEFKNKIENLLTEKFNQKVVLEDVQIIHR